MPPPGGFPTQVSNPGFLHWQVGSLPLAPLWKIPRRRKWKPTPVFLPGESHGQKNLVGYNPRAQKESNMTEVTEHAHTSPGENFSCLT